jgi:ubiquinone/menaquinone biosynthesis C-methylase UbiE
LLGKVRKKPTGYFIPFGILCPSPYNQGMNYIIESGQEARRLELQNALPQYSISEELKYLELDLTGKKILDAGCGTGSLARILSDQYQSEISGCDASSDRIQGARSLSGDEIHFFSADLTAMPVPDNEYDVIFVRFVLEHTQEPKKIIHELSRVLKSGGYLIVIDLDGLIFNLHHQDEKLARNLSLLQKNLPIDLYIGRKLPRMLKEAGLRLSECHVQSMLFQNQDLENEVDNMRMRFYQSQAAIKEIIGDDEYDRFIASYLKEMRRAQAIFCNKFIVSALKP